MRNKIFLFIVSFFLFSCSASKALYEVGLKFEEAGMYSEASNRYYESLKLDNDNVDASIALKKVGVRLYQEQADDVMLSNKKGEHNVAVFSFLKAEEYRKKLNLVGVNITKDKNAQLSFEISKDIYSKESVQKINNLIAEEKFRESEILLNELVLLNPSSQEFQEMKAIAFSEPVYREGLKNIESNYYKKAYYNFNKIQNYRDSKDLMKLSQEKATFRIAIIPIKNNTSRIELSDKLYVNIYKSIFDNKDPFLQIIDQNQVKDILNDKGIDITEFKNTTSPKFLKMISDVFRVEAFLMGTIIDANYRIEEPRMQRKRAYIEYKYNKKNSKTGKNQTYIDYRPIEYSEYTKLNEVTVSFNFTLIAKEGDMLISDVITQNESSNVHYAQYAGDYRTLLLVPRGGSMQDENFRNLFTASKEVKNTSLLESEVTLKITKILANKLKEYNPDKYYE